MFITHNLEEVNLSDRVLVLIDKPTRGKTEIKNDLPRVTNEVSKGFIGLRNRVIDLTKY